MVAGFSYRRLQELRSEASLLERDVAAAVGCSTVAVYNWEAGRESPGPATLLNLARALDVSPGDLLVTPDSDADLRGLRVRAGVTQQTAATLVRLHRAAFSRIERGLRPLPPAVTAQMAAVYGVTPARLQEAWDTTFRHRLNRPHTAAAAALGHGAVAARYRQRSAPTAEKAPQRVPGGTGQGIASLT